MKTCQKCFKQSPAEAAFCGFCGASMVSGGGDKSEDPKRTVFGYMADKAESEQTPQLVPPQAAAPAPTAAPTAAPPSSQVGGRYQLLAERERLAVGVLWNAKDSKEGQEIDLLLVDGGVFPSPLDLERARREMRQLQKVDCPNILPILDHGKHDGQLYIAMEHVAAAPLTKLLSQGKLDIDRAQNMIREVGTALAEAQKVGVVHRDIAPHNLLVMDNGDTRIRGFGISPSIKRHVFGTPEYMSPEQASGRPVDQRSNIYSLGALMYHMLSGAPPFSGSPEELLTKHQKEDPPALSSELKLPPRVEQLVSKALAKSSSRRHLTLRQFLREVESLSVSKTAPPAPKQPMSFETPLHGVTALTGGDRPPSSEMPGIGLGRPQQVLKPTDLPAPPVLETDDTSPALPAQRPDVAPTQEAPKSKPVIPATVQPADLEPPAPIAPPTDSSPITLTPKEPKEPDDDLGRLPTHPPVTSDAGGVVGGEMRAGERIAMRQSEEHIAVEPAQSQPAPQPSGAPGKAGFRETMWFFKGEVESAMAEDGEADPPPPETGDMADLADKYRDDGSLSDEAAARLSLRTGKTSAMQAVKVPDGHIPGKKMQAEDFISEMNRGRTIAIWAGIGVVAIALIGVGIWLALKLTSA